MLDSGKLIGMFVVAPLIVVAIAYVIVKVWKKRSMTPVEMVIAFIVAEVLIFAGQVAKSY